MLSETLCEEVVLGKEGRILLSVRVRNALQLVSGETLHLSIEDGRVILEKRQRIAARLKQRVKAAAGSKSLSQQLLRERRRDAKHE